MNSIKKGKIFLLLILMIGISSAECAEKNFPNEGVKSSTIILPHVYKTLETKTAFCISYVRLPDDWVETSIDAPILQVSNKTGLPLGFALESSFQSIFIANQFRFGPHWNAEVGRFSFSAGLDAGLLFGKMDISGFNNKAKGWMMYPTISIGYCSNDLAFTLIAERSSIQTLTFSSGSVETSDFKNLKSGQTFSINLEQKLWGKHVMILGLINNFQKFYFPAWPAFSAFNRRYYIPQMYIGLIL